MNSFVFFALAFVSSWLPVVENTEIARNKRFFQNLNAYFSKTSATDVAAAISTSNSCDSAGNCSFNGDTPATYLTPPTPEENKYFASDYGRKYLPSNDRRASSQGIFDGSNKAFAPANTSLLTEVYATPAIAATYDSLQVKLKDMICVKSAKNGRFSVGMVTSKSLPASPILENVYATEKLPQCSVTTLDSTTYQLNIHEPDMIKCGVYYCDSDTETNLMCVTLRFPIIPGIRTSNDVITRIECRPQQQTLTHVTQLNLKSNPAIGRSLPVHTTITGGSPKPELHTQIGLYTMTETGYTQQLGNNDFVSVGQQLQLRSIVKAGNGWNFSRLGQVLVQKVLSSSNGYSYGENLDSVVIVADDGCVNPRMKPVCQFGPFNDPSNPLISILNLQMFIFDGMKDGDELSMTITVLGCIYYEDCFPANNVCQSWQTPTRYRRSTNAGNITDRISEIKLRVRNLSKKGKLFKCNETGCKEEVSKLWTNSSIILVLCVSSLVAVVIGYAIYKNSKFPSSRVQRL